MGGRVLTTDRGLRFGIVRSTIGKNRSLGTETSFRACSYHESQDLQLQVLWQSNSSGTKYAFTCLLLGNGHEGGGMANRRRILAVDDDEGVRDYLLALLPRLGFEAKAVARGEDVLWALESWKVDLVILDLVLPGMNGFEVFRLVKERWPETPIMFLSGHGRAPNVVEAMHLGAANFLCKPFEVEDLERALTEIFAVTQASEICPTCSGSGRIGV